MQQGVVSTDPFADHAKQHVHAQHVQQHSDHFSHHHSHPTTIDVEKNTNEEDGTWLLITSTMGITLGYVRIDDHDHELRLSEIREMIDEKLHGNNEYAHGWNFGTGWPLKIVQETDEHNVFAKDVLPSVSVLSARSAHHIISTANPMNTATAIQYGLSPGNMHMNYSANLNMNMGFPNSASLQPLPISAAAAGMLSAVPMVSAVSDAGNQGHFVDAMGPSSAKITDVHNSTSQYYSSNTIALLQPSQSQSDENNNNVINMQSNTNKDAIKDEAEEPQTAESDNNGERQQQEQALLSSASEAAQIPSLPPISPPILSQQQIEEKARVQKAKLLNLLPRKYTVKTEDAVNTEAGSNNNGKESGGSTPRKTGSGKSTPKSTKSKSGPKTAKMALPRLKAMDANGNVIEPELETKKVDENTDTNNSNNDTENDNNAANKNNSSNLPPTAADQINLYCPTCDKRFDKPRAYKQHMTKQHQIKIQRGRNKERRFECSSCNKCFYQSSDLRRHQRVHLGVKPFRCSACLREFTQRGSLYRHIKSVHKSTDTKKFMIIQDDDATLPEVQKKREPSTQSSQHEENSNTDVYMDVNMNMNGIPPLIAAVEAVIADLPPEVPVVANANDGIQGDIHADPTVAEEDNDVPMKQETTDNAEKPPQ